MRHLLASLLGILPGSQAYRLMIYELLLVLVSLGFLVLLGQTLHGLVRCIVTFDQLKIAPLRARRSLLKPALSQLLSTQQSSQ
jgi:hypothetical protein